MERQYTEYEDTPLWRTLNAAITELVAQKEIEVHTAPRYVIGYLCQQLALQNLLAPHASTYEP